MGRNHWLRLGGSSPLVRGQPISVRPDEPSVRIIPARAGPTFCRCGKSILYPDHPRSCGANQVSVFRVRWHYGSSPLVRGQRFAIQFIKPFVSDHPRSCGANRLMDTRTTRKSGSSPLVRGQPGLHVAIRFTNRIIPARAGPTIFNGRFLIPNADHPRSCGANAIASAASSSVSGSSPLVRGQQSDFTRKKRVESNKNI